MASILWANLINMYQPPNRDRTVLEKIVNRGFLPVLKIFEQNPSYIFSLNLPGSTVELLIKAGFGNVIEKLAKLAERRQVDFTITPKYQPLIPLVGDDEVDRQIEAHNKICKRYFGIYYKPQGMYSPYLAYSLRVSKIGARFALKWLSVDEVSLGLRHHISLYMDRLAGGIILMPFRREISHQMNGSPHAKKVPRSASELVRSMLTQASNDKYLITVSDAQSFGYDYSNRHGLLGALYRDAKLKPVSVSQLRHFVKPKEFTKPGDGSSETGIDKGKRKKSFLMFQDDKNPIQQNLWKLYNMAVSEIRNAGAKGDQQYIRAREMLDYSSGAINWAMLSCSPWWDSRYPLQAANDLAIAIFILSSSSPKVKENAIALRVKINDQIERFEKSGEMRKMQKAFLKANNIPFDRFYKK